MSLGTLVCSYNHVLLVILWFISLNILSSRFLWSLPICEWEICVCASVCMCTYLHMEARAMCGALLSHFPCYFLPESHWIWTSQVGKSGLTGREFLLFPPSLGLCICGTSPVFCVCAGEPNSGCHTYTTSALPTEPSSQSWFSFFLWMTIFFISCHSLFTHWPISKWHILTVVTMFKWSSEYR